MSDYTPGPWSSHHCKRTANIPDTWEIHWSDDGECVAEIVHGEADANLIASAPELLEACEAIIEAWNHPMHLGLSVAINKAIRATYKAEGKTQ